jgi:chemotaxis protein MotB
MAHRLAFLCAEEQAAGRDPSSLRIARVIGRAETEPLIADNPNDPRNRRISIILLRDIPAT